MNSLGHNLWISHDWEYRYASVGHRYLLKNILKISKKVGAWIRKPVSITPQSPLHRVDQAVDCALWNVIPLLFNGCVKLLDIVGKWNTLLYMSIQSIPNMLNYLDI